MRLVEIAEVGSSRSVKSVDLGRGDFEVGQDLDEIHTEISGQSRGRRCVVGGGVGSRSKVEGRWRAGI